MQVTQTRGRGRPPKAKGPLEAIDNRLVEEMFLQIAADPQVETYYSLLDKANKGAATSYASKAVYAEFMALLGR